MVDSIAVSMWGAGKNDGSQAVYAVYVDSRDITLIDRDLSQICVDPDTDDETLQDAEDALEQALVLIRAERARRLVGRRVRQKYNVTPFETGGETFHYTDGVVRDAEWSDELQRYTLAVVYDVDGDVEYNVEVDDYVEFLDKAATP